MDYKMVKNALEKRFGGEWCIMLRLHPSVAKEAAKMAKEEYDLLIEYDELPFPLAESNEELTREIEKFNQEAYERNLAGFMDRYGIHEDGHASERAAKLIVDLIYR